MAETIPGLRTGEDSSTNGLLVHVAASMALQKWGTGFPFMGLADHLWQRKKKTCDFLPSGREWGVVTPPL